MLPTVSPGTPFRCAAESASLPQNGSCDLRHPGRGVARQTIGPRSRGGEMSTVLSGAPPVTDPLPLEAEAKPPYPGIPTTSDGAGMVVWVETHITQGEIGRAS